MNNITPESLSLLIHYGVKFMIVVGLSMYTVLSAVIVRQSELMDKVIDETFEPVLRLLVILHFLASLALVILALIII